MSIKYPFTDFHEMNLDWILKTVKDLQEVYKDIPAELQTIVEKWLEDHPEILLKNFYIDPYQYGAVGDGVTDDTLAFQTMAAACNEKSFVVIPKGTYLLNSDVFCNVDLKSNEGIFPNKHFITQNNKDVMFSESNIMNTNVVDIPSGFTVQAFTYNENDDIYYLGTTATDDNTQTIITLDNRLQKISEVTFHEPILHMNTLTYDPVDNKLLTIRSNGHEILEMNLQNATVSRLLWLDDFNSGIQYDSALDLFIGVNGPPITGIRKWNYRAYDRTWHKVYEGEFENPYGYNLHETPNGFCVNNGLIVSAAFNTWGVQYGAATRIQYIFSTDLFGHTRRVYQEFYNNREMEGIAFNGKQFITGAVLCDGKALITMIDPDAIFSTSINNINQRCELPVNWDSQYVEALVGHFNINARERRVECSGYIRLVSNHPSGTQFTLGTIPDNYTPWGNNVVLPSAGGTVPTSLVIVNNEIRAVMASGAGRYLNVGGYWYY